MSNVLLIFIDGLGLGADDPARNPLAATGITLGSDVPLTLAQAGQSKQAAVIPTDACLGLPGLPQSATGQCTLLSGVNAAALLGQHLPAYPNPTLARLLAEHGMFTWCRDQGLSATFANGYSREYWRMVEQGKRRHSATTLAVLGAGGRFRDEQDFNQGSALYHDITGHALRLLGRDIPPLAPEEAGRRLARLAAENRFTLFEYFLTDVAGHRRQWDSALIFLEHLDVMIRTVLQESDLSQLAVICTSDHGNFEDFSVPGHTRNPVPTILYGPVARQLAPDIASLVDIAPAMQRVLKTPAVAK